MESRREEWRVVSEMAYLITPFRMGLKITSIPRPYFAKRFAMQAESVSEKKMEQPSDLCSPDTAVICSMRWPGLQSKAALKWGEKFPSWR